MAAFCDLNVLREENPQHLKTKLSMLTKLGYENFAVNYVVEDIQGKAKGSKKSKEKVLIKCHQNHFQQSSSKCQNVRQFSRFTAVLNDSLQGRRLHQDPEIQKYDLVAVQPTGKQFFDLACKELSVDIISLDLTQSLDFHFTRQPINVAIEKGIHFEICYSPLVMDSASRKKVLANSLALIRVCKGKNIIISSGCQKALELRGPYDVANIALLTGLTEAQTKQCLSRNCHQVLMHAAARKSEKGLLSVFPKESFMKGQTWKLGYVREIKKDVLEEIEPNDGEPPAKKKKKRK
ncbi:hypothetical protein CAPTEDRAFT_220335 [Capitella teleta]|uniref:Uncharacterized protein n=1 Tax=Capitella teleta TaxID=283909 RepID=R7TWH2_CAPTE|nr:hypothetical protein CAPTEDRAFT_220335 [Capitella teleta]|eukprot:ELT98263.1 hypothetical protein CAPTEDRAFT_220335 [Capitella teleta]